MHTNDLLAKTSFDSRSLDAIILETKQLPSLRDKCQLFCQIFYSTCRILGNFQSLKQGIYCIVLFLWGGHCCPMHNDIFKIYCAPLKVLLGREYAD